MFDERARLAARSWMLAGVALLTVVTTAAAGCSTKLTFQRGDGGGGAGAAGRDGAASGSGGADWDGGWGGSGGAVASDDAGADPDADAAAPGTGGAGGADAGATPDAGGFACAIDGDCRLGTLHCLTAIGRAGECVECLGDAHCPNAGARRCDLLTHRCVECTSATHCPAADYSSTCTTVSRRCLTGCSDDSVAAMMCPTTRSYVCNDERYLCVECLTNADCATSAHGPVCHPSEYVCVRCLSGGCGAGQLCDAVTGQCVECRTFYDCKTPGLPLCDPTTHACVSAT